MIKEVYLWSNGQVLVFDERGHQIPEYQGEQSECLPKIKALNQTGIIWHRGDWNLGLTYEISEAEAYAPNEPKRRKR